MDREEELDIAIKQAANLANWRLSLFFFSKPPRRAPLQPLKHRERGAAGSGCSRGTEKKSIGVPPLVSLAPAASSPKKKRVAEAGCAWRQGVNGRVRRGTRKGGADGGGGRTKGKTKAGRHSRTPSRKHGRSRERRRLLIRRSPIFRANATKKKRRH